MKFYTDRFYCPVLLLLMFSAVATVVCADDSFLSEQLNKLVRFSQVHNEEMADPGNKVTIEFIKASQEASGYELCDQRTDALTAFFRLAFDDGKKPSYSARLKALQVAGREEYARSNKKNTDHESHPFARHVIDAIELNRERMVYYEQVSNGATRSLSRAYIGMEYSLIPMARIFDFWARKYRKMGIPVLSNDFVSMDLVARHDAQLKHTGVLDDNGLNQLHKLLKDYQYRVYAAAARKNFARVELESLRAYKTLQKIESYYKCNLTLANHFVESIGLAAKNARDLHDRFDGRADNFYRAYIALQNAGVRIFGWLDLMAQPFHQKGIGIIVNDIPPIPFP